MTPFTVVSGLCRSPCWCLSNVALKFFFVIAILILMREPLPVYAGLVLEEQFTDP